VRWQGGNQATLMLAGVLAALTYGYPLLAISIGVPVPLLGVVGEQQSSGS
jgi:hypothetical protein